MMKRMPLLTICLAACTAIGCSARTSSRQVEPVRFEDGTPVSSDPQADSLFALDRFLTDTTFTEKGDTLFTLRHTSAYVRWQLDGRPGGTGRILLVPTEGAATEIPVDGPETEPVVLWTAEQPGRNPAAAVIAFAPDGRIWSARLPELQMKAGTAYRRDAVFLPPEAPGSGIQAMPLPQTLLDTPSGEYSGITWIAAHYYAVVSDNMTGGGLLTLTLPMDREGNVSGASMVRMEGTAVAKSDKPDNEGVAFADGKLYVSTEKQTIREYDESGRPTGMHFAIPEDMGPGSIASNMGFEALTYGNGLFWTTTEGPLKNDTFLPRLLRLQSFGREGKPAQRYFYQMEAPARSRSGTQAYVHGVPALAALEDGRLIVLEREVYVPNGGFFDKLMNSFTRMRLFVVDPLNDPAGILRKSPLCSFQTGAMDLANFEGMCLGPTLPDGRRTLVMIADSQNGAGGLTSEYVKVILLR